MGASTGNMLVDQDSALIRIFTSAPMLIAAHCENQDIIQSNTELIRRQAANGRVPMFNHSIIRSVEACFTSSQKAVELAQMTHARLHLLHLSTGSEVNLMRRLIKESDERLITAEACVGHLWFHSADCRKLDTLIKVNPAIKTSIHRDALRKAIKAGYILSLIHI